MDKRKFALQGVGATTLMLALLAGCATHSPPTLDQDKVKQFAGRGYLTDERYSITTTYFTWEADGRSFDVALTLPTKSGPFPLLVYLPGLGENRSAGEHWRTAWAQGGYAVISIQPLAQDAGAWSSVRARAGDFTSLAGERYSTNVMTERIAALRTALKELSRRHTRREELLERIDLSHVAIAGYDLGAYTGMVLAGERIQNTAPARLSLPINAVVALSPYADFSGVPFAERYAAIRVPVLSVTSDNDSDPLARVTSPSVRRAPFEYMPAGDKYLLSLSNITHADLSGGERSDEAEQDRFAERSGMHGRSPDESPSGRRGGTDMRGPGAGGPPSREGLAALEPSRSSPTDRALDMTIIQGVTTAFLDSCLRGDPIAREWLDRDVRRWIKGRGELKAK